MCKLLARDGSVSLFPADIDDQQANAIVILSPLAHRVIDVIQLLMAQVLGASHHGFWVKPWMSSKLLVVVGILHVHAVNK